MRKNGFTLIEVLVVLVIIAIITAVAVMAFGHFGQDRREKILVEQFVQTISVAQQQAILAPTVLGLTFTDAGYRYYSYQLPMNEKPGYWRPITNVLSRPVIFRGMFTVTVTLSDAASPPSNANNKDAPTITFLPSGSVTPFVLELQGKTKTFQVTVKNNGSVSTDASAPVSNRKEHR